MHKNRDIQRNNSAHGGDSPNGNFAGAGRSHLVNPAGDKDGEKRPPAAGSSFAARFGRAIVQHGVAAIPSALFHYQGRLDLSAQEVWFISYVMCFKWDESLPRVNLSQMEKRVGMGKRSLYRLKDRLCEANYLKVLPVFTENGRQDSSAYDFSGLFEEIERLILLDPARANPIHTDDPDENSRDEEPADHDMSFLARFGRVIVRYGVAAVPQAVFTYQAALGLTPQQVWFISYIFSYQWKKALPYPSIVKMSARTGYSTVQLHEIKSSLVERGYLQLVPRSTKQGGRDSNAYDFSGLFDALRAHLQREHNESKSEAAVLNVVPQEPARPRPSRRRGRVAAQSATRHLSNTQQAALSEQSNEGDSGLTGVGDAKLSGESDSQLLYVGGAQFADQGDSQRIEEGEPEFSWDGDAGITQEGDDKLTPSVSRKPPARVTPGYQKRVTPTLHNVEPIQEEKRADSNHISRNKTKARNNTQAVSSPISAYISAVMDDFSNELDNADHKTSNATQALRLWQASGLSEQDFIQLVYEAKQLTRQYQGKSGLRGIENKMAYFFAVLRDLCRLPDPPDTGGNARGHGREEPSAQRKGVPDSHSESTDMISARQLWYAALTELRSIVPASSFQTWFKNTAIAAFQSNTVVIAVPTTFAQEWLEKRYGRQVAETLHNVLGYRVDVRFEVRSQGTRR